MCARNGFYMFILELTSNMPLVLATFFVIGWGLLTWFMHTREMFTIVIKPNQHAVSADIAPFAWKIRSYKTDIRIQHRFLNADSIIGSLAEFFTAKLDRQTFNRDNKRGIKKIQKLGCGEKCISVYLEPEIYHEILDTMNKNKGLFVNNCELHPAEISKAFGIKIRQN